VTSLNLPGPFDLGLTLDCGQMFRAERGKDGWWQFVDGPNAYVAKVEGQRLEFDRPVSAEKVRALFSFDLDLAGLRSRALAAAPELHASFGDPTGLRPMRLSCPVEVLFCFLCSQNNHIPRIKGMVAHLADRGEPIPGAEWARRFPSLEVLAGMEESTLRGLGFGYRARAIPLCAQAIAAEGGVAWLHSLKSEPYERAHRVLLALPGVGPKVADCVCLHGLHMGEAVPVDVHVWRRVVEVFFPEWSGKDLDPRRYRLIGERFRSRFRAEAGFVQQLLFVRSLRSSRSVARSALGDPNIDEAIAEPRAG